MLRQFLRDRWNARANGRWLGAVFFFVVALAVSVIITQYVRWYVAVPLVFGVALYCWLTPPGRDRG